MSPHRYRVKQGREREEHDGHDEVDQVADGEGYQEGVKLPLVFLAAEHKNGQQISKDPQNPYTRLQEKTYFIVKSLSVRFMRFYSPEVFPPQTI